MIRCEVLLLLTTFLFVGVSGQSVRWGRWSSWTRCTRTCGGGVTQRTRECIKYRQTNDKCDGSSIEYSMCNIQDCPDRTPDFRMQQCSQYDKISYKGKLYKWASYAHSAGICELKCMPKTEFFYVTFKDKVIDGTLCSEFSMDVCINGTCRSVGCDNQLDSGAKIDRCGVCRGDGKSCKLMSRTFSTPQDAFGYVHVTTIPAGATNIVIKENAKPSMYLALIHTNGVNIINGDYVIASPGTSKFQNNVLVYTNDQKENKITLTGPTETPIEVKIFILDKKNDVYFEYYIPNSSPTNVVQKTEYIYIVEPWSECSKECAEGVKKRNVYCAIKGTRDKIPAFNCDSLVEPSTSESCNIQSCTPRWYISQWSPCSTTCGRGLRTRRVHCMRTKKDGNDEMLELSRCPGQIPKTFEVCVDQGSCPKWTSREWSKCSKSCGEGYQSRQVLCVNIDDSRVEYRRCSAETKPTDRQACFNAPCGARWKTESWGECSSQCGKGMRSRSVTCVNSEGFDVPKDHCEASKEPSHFQECVTSGPCRPTWGATAWNKCSAKCGKGSQMRVVYCSLLIPDGNNLKIVDDSRCRAEDKPSISRPCGDETPCYANYFVSGWKRCSSACGIGVSKRTVRCYADRKIDYTEKACAQLTRPADYRICKITNCPGSNVDTSVSAITTKRPVEIRITTTATTTKTKEPTNSSPIVIGITGSSSLNENENGDFICKVSGGNPKPQIRWYFNNRAIQDPRFTIVEVSQGSRLTIRDVREADQGYLRCYATNSYGYSSKQIKLNVERSKTTTTTTRAPVTTTRAPITTARAPITTGSSPNVIEITGLRSLNENEKGDFICKVSGGNPKPQIRWYFNNRAIQDPRFTVVEVSQGSRLTIREVREADQGYLRCYATNTYGYSSKQIKLNVERSKTTTTTTRAPITTTKAPITTARAPTSTGSSPNVIEIAGPRSLNENENGDFICKVSGGYPKRQIRWYFNNRAIQDPRFTVVEVSQGSRLTIREVREADQGYLRCYATNSYGYSSKQIKLNVERSKTTTTTTRAPVTTTRAPITTARAPTSTGSSPNVIEIAGPRSLNENENGDFICKVSGGNPKPQIRWYLNNRAIQDPRFTVVEVSQGSRLTIGDVREADQGYLRCYATNSYGYSSKQIKLNVELSKTTTTTTRAPITTTRAPTSTGSSPNVIEIAGPRSLNENENGDFICKVSGGNPKPQIQWYLNGKKMSNGRFTIVEVAQGSMLVIDEARFADSGNLTCYAGNKYGYSRKEITLNISVKPTGGFEQSEVTKTKGEKYVMSCKMQGTPKPRIRWLKDNDIFEPRSSQITINYGTIQFDKLDTNDAGKYECMAWNTAGTAKASLQLKINAGEEAVDVNCKDFTNCAQTTAFGLCDFPYYKDYLCCKTCKDNSNAN